MTKDVTGAPRLSWRDEVLLIGGRLCPPMGGPHLVDQEQVGFLADSREPGVGSLPRKMITSSPASTRTSSSDR